MAVGHVCLDRAPLSASELAEGIIRPGGLWCAIAVTGQTGSTNADLLAQAAGGAPEGSVLVAETQTAGRGRLDRAWRSPPGAGLTFSMLLRPRGVSPARRGWLPLLTGVAVASAVRAGTGVAAGLKWPNDVLAGPRKLAGILAEQSGEAVVVGVGLNVSTTRAELPVETATSLLIEQTAQPDDTDQPTGTEIAQPVGPDQPTGTEIGQPFGADQPTGADQAAGTGRADRTGQAAGTVTERPAGTGQAIGVSRARLLAGILAEFERLYLAWAGGASPGDPESSGLRPAYRQASLTLGRVVRAELPGGAVITGTAQDIDPDGRLVLTTPQGPHPLSAADIIHLR